MLLFSFGDYAKENRNESDDSAASTHGERLKIEPYTARKILNSYFAHLVPADLISMLDAERTLLSLQEQLALSQTRAATSMIGVYKSFAGGL